MVSSCVNGNFPLPAFVELNNATLIPGDDSLLLLLP